MDTTQHDLKVLSICYYIMAGINGAYAILAAAYVLFIEAILTNVPLRNTAGKALPDFVPAVIAGFGGALAGFGLVCAACMAFAAWSLPKRRNYVVVMVAAILNCLQIPFGTVLGVFTFVVLNRPGVRHSFENNSLARVPPPLPPALL